MAAGLQSFQSNDKQMQAIRELTNEVFRLKQIVNELNGGGGGGNLPEPTIADAGKVLGVDDEGKYALVEGGEWNIIALAEEIEYENNLYIPYATGDFSKYPVIFTYLSSKIMLTQWNLMSNLSVTDIANLIQRESPFYFDGENPTTLPSVNTYDILTFQGSLIGMPDYQVMVMITSGELAGKFIYGSAS